MEPLKFCFIIIVTPLTNGAVPGTFYWKPRMGIDLTIPVPVRSQQVVIPTKENIRDGLVVLVNGYEAGVTFLVLASGLADASPYPHLNPARGYFYTNAYRWALRHISMLPIWLRGEAATKYTDTHKVWRKRFIYMDEIIPKWLRSSIFYVNNKDWDKEIKEQRRYKKFSENAFSKHYRFPNKNFNDFKSYETKETEEEVDSQSGSFHSSAS